MATDEPIKDENEQLTDPGPVERKNIFRLIMDWPLKRKIALGAVTLVSLSLFALLIIQSRVADYQLLYANLAEADAGAVVNWLKSQKIPYQLKNNGRNIWIGADKIYETRLSLAANGLPRGGGVGFEVFDKQSFALTDYVQKVNYTRALQGELARTITSLAPVEATRVHLALPEKRLFKNQQKSPKASVIVTLTAGRRLEPDQVQGIIHLVSGSVTGLNPENVKVIDSNGMVLEGERKKDEENLLSTDMLAFQQHVEHRMEMRAQDLLDTIMGKNRAMVRVTAVLDFSKVEKTEELFDSEEPVVRSEQMNQESKGGQTSGGIPGVQSNLQGNTGGLSSHTPPVNKTSRVTNYEISKTISKIVNPVGTIQSLSVSILVADRTISKDKGKSTQTLPLDDEELQSIERMISSALGIDKKRGDQINIVSMPFTVSPEEELLSERIPAHFLYEFLPIIKICLIVLAALLCYALLIRPVMKTLKGEVTEHYKTVEELERERNQIIQRKQREEQIHTVTEEDFITDLRNQVMRNPAPTAYIIKNWIQEA